MDIYNKLVFILTLTLHIHGSIMTTNTDEQKKTYKLDWFRKTYTEQ
ncbi:MAG: hypothetical protein IKJ59_15240 [Clostridia bacterium]|nr:hypothetical protein [Clostridia bacterium]